MVLFIFFLIGAGLTALYLFLFHPHYIYYYGLDSYIFVLVIFGIFFVFAVGLLMAKGNKEHEID